MVSAVPAPAASRLGVSEPEVVVVAVTYNSEAVVEPFLVALPDALTGLTSAHVIIVDNGSTDRTVDRVKQLAPWATVLEAGANLGYAGGINAGLRYQQGSNGVVVLNPDTVPSRGCLARLAEAVAADERVGIAVPKIVDADGGLNYSLRRKPSLLRALGEAVLGGRRAARYPLLGETIRTADYYVDGAEADWASGAAMFVARRALDVAGLWSDDYFLYSEETDYALRVGDAGLCVRLVGGAEVVHRGGELKRSPWLWSLQAVNRTRLYRRRHGRIASGAYWCAVVLNEGIRSFSGPTHRAALKALLLGHPTHKKRSI